MMRIYLFIGMMITTAANYAQELWEKQPISLGYGVRGMYYDEAMNVSYIYGNIQEIEGDTTNIIIYDGADYYSMPRCPISYINDVQYYKGKLYAAGRLLSSLAVWDGVSWKSLEHNGVIFNLKVIDDKLYAIGDFESMAGIPARNIAVYNDTTWESFLGVDTVINQDWAFNDVIFYKGNAYVCGNFTDWGAPPIKDIMMHDGERWKSVGGFIIDGLGYIGKMLVWRDTLYVAGMMVEATGSPGNCIAAWDGENWHKLQEGINVWSGASGGSVIYDMEVINDELWVCGFFNRINGRFVHDNYGGVAKWNGSEWCTMNLWREGSVVRFGNWQDEIFITGEFALYDDWDARRVVKWVGGDYTDTCVQSFPTSIDDGSKGLHNVSLYPNPAQKELFLNYYYASNMSINSHLKIEVIDLNGKIIEHFDKNINMGYNTHALDISDLNNGYYILNIYNGITMQSINFTKQ